ncbi:hypothetical protein CU098_013412 [Rhizopus stolonifer]|uniref:non-specific serine/threonine protein kinase n=1 Tax=Rhizopus stolonifer TaxID=4846 RepID=A0A367KWY8_RHIST|nr:hypothetical protein CU098_013412 [Rhizopus stolonifer]
MDSRGIPIVTTQKCPTTPRRSHVYTGNNTPRRNDIPSSPFVVPNLRNEQSLLEAYDSFTEACFQSHFNHSLASECYTMRDLFKADLFPSLGDLHYPSTRKRSLTADTDDLPNLEVSKKSKNQTVEDDDEEEEEDELDMYDRRTMPDLVQPPIKNNDSHNSPIQERKEDSSLPEQKIQSDQQHTTQDTEPINDQADVTSTKEDIHVVECNDLINTRSALDLSEFQVSSLSEYQSILSNESFKEVPAIEKQSIRQEEKEIPAIEELVNEQKEEQAPIIEKPTIELQQEEQVPVIEVPVIQHKENQVPVVEEAASSAQDIDTNKNTPPIQEPINTRSKTRSATAQTITPSPTPSPQRLTRSQKKLLLEQGAEDTLFTIPELPPSVRRSSRIKENLAPKSVSKVTKKSVQKKPTNKKPVKEEEEAPVAEPTKKKESEEEYKRKLQRKAESDAEIEKINASFPFLTRYYQLLYRAGSGTFSRVYKAKDLLVDQYMPLEQKERLVDAMGHLANINHVAIKLILDISTPMRVANEIECLVALRSSPGITPLITAFRNEAITYVVLPYIEFDHFEDLYATMSLEDTRSYISELLIGLQSAHEKGIVHRDVKPGNFLYSRKTKHGYLADFGLAKKTFTAQPSKRDSNKTYPSMHPNGQIGYYIDDTRPSLQGDRSGTRGFRAPELMMRYRYQTTAVDMWAVGVILLIILSGQYPFFEPEDDADGIMELAHIFGMKKLKEFVEYYGRVIHTNIPTIPEDPVDLGAICHEINEKRVKSWDPEEYRLAVDLMNHCLQLIHTNRLTATEALNHPFIKRNQV